MLFRSNKLPEVLRNLLQDAPPVPEMLRPTFSRTSNIATPSSHPSSTAKLKHGQSNERKLPTDTTTANMDAPAQHSPLQNSSSKKAKYNRTRTLHNKNTTSSTTISVSEPTTVTKSTSVHHVPPSTLDYANESDIKIADDHTYTHDDAHEENAATSSLPLPSDDFPPLPPRKMYHEDKNWYKSFRKMGNRFSRNGRSDSVHSSYAEISAQNPEQWGPPIRPALQPSRQPPRRNRRPENIQWTEEQESHLEASMRHLRQRFRSFCNTLSVIDPTWSISKTVESMIFDHGTQKLQILGNQKLIHVLLRTRDSELWNTFSVMFELWIQNNDHQKEQFDILEENYVQAPSVGTFRKQFDKSTSTMIQSSVVTPSLRKEMKNMTPRFNVSEMISDIMNFVFRSQKRFEKLTEYLKLAQEAKSKEDFIGRIATMLHGIHGNVPFSIAFGGYINPCMHPNANYHEIPVQAWKNQCLEQLTNKQKDWFKESETSLSYHIYKIWYEMYNQELYLALWATIKDVEMYNTKRLANSAFMGNGFLLVQVLTQESLQVNNLRRFNVLQLRSKIQLKEGDITESAIKEYFEKWSDQHSIEEAMGFKCQENEKTSHILGGIQDQYLLSKIDLDQHQHVNSTGEPKIWDPHEIGRAHV